MNSRQAFEVWCKSFGLQPLPKDDEDCSGSYTTSVAWYAWKASREAVEAKSDAERMNQPIYGYLYLEEGGYNHNEVEKFSKTKPLMVFSNNLTVITGEVYAQPFPSTEQLQQRVKELKDALQIALRQNSHDMLMTGDEIRLCEKTLANTQ